MRVVFIHQNMPGQYKHLAPRLAADGHEVVFITKRRNIELPGVRRIVYDLSREPNSQGHRYARHFDGQLLYGQAVARVLIKLRDEGFHPDLICAHSGWGEAMFIKDIFPDSSLQVFSEFFYRGQGADVGFEDKGEASLDAQCRARARNAHMLIAMADAESLIAPTIWQWQQHPQALRERMVVIHDGIDSAACRPDPTATFTLPTGEILSREDEVITYMARNLEPYRGFHKFMAGLESLLERRPNARVIIVGGDEISYGSGPEDGKNWREVLLAKHKVDPLRVHFVGRLPYDTYIRFLQISRVHVYMTYPFVLSWSSMESMAAGCAIAASSTPPVREVMRDGENALLFDFFNPEQMVDQVCRLLDDAALRARLGAAARQTILDHYDLHTIALPRQMEVLTRLAGKQPLNGAYVPTADSIIDVNG